MSRPATYKQSSRKGKKAWRKNIDVEDIERNLQEQAQNEINYGVKNVENLKDESLFELDTEGDDRLEKLTKKSQHGKVTKSKDILNKINQQSKVPALKTYNKNTANKDKIQGVEKKNIKKLMQLAGRSLKADDKANAHMERKGGLVKGSKKDLWGDEGANKELKTPSGFLTLKQKDFDSIKNLPKTLLKQSLTSFSKGTVQPESMKKAPIEVFKFEDAVVNDAKSYNPDMKKWEEFFQKEYLSEKEKDDKRKMIEEYKLKIQHLMDTLDDNEIADSSDDEEEEEDVDDEEDNSENKFKLSINPAVQNKKKNRTQRNKEKRLKERLSLESEIKEVKKQLKELEKVIITEEKELENGNNENKQQDIKKLPSSLEIIEKRVQKKRKLGTKQQIMEPLLEIKFKDEMNGSLRKLKPEGSLLYDSMIKLQSKGVIETRGVFRKGRKPKRKVTDKWTYKDFK
jgi:nucleolar protein 53